MIVEASEDAAPFSTKECRGPAVPLPLLPIRESASVRRRNPMTIRPMPANTSIAVRHELGNPKNGRITLNTPSKMTPASLDIGASYPMEKYKKSAHLIGWRACNFLLEFLN